MTVLCIIDENTIQYLKSRLSQLEENKKQVIESLLSTTKSINELREVFISSKKIDQGLILSALEELENDLTISSYTVEETRAKEKQIDKLNKDLVTARQLEVLEEEYNSQKNKRHLLKHRLVEIRKEITEVESAICVAWVIVYKRRKSIEITPDEVNSEMLVLSERRFIQLLKRPIIARLECQLCIKCTYCRSLSACLVYGDQQTIPMAIEILQDSLTWGVSSIPYQSLEVAILLYRNCKYLHEIENESATVFYIRNDTQQLSLQGGEKARQKALQLYQSFFADRMVIQLSDAVFVRLASKTKPYLSSLKAQSNCYFYLDYKKQILYVYGSPLEKKQTQILLDALLPSLEVIEKRLELTDANQVAFLIGDKGSNIRTLTCCNYTFSSKNETPSITLQGCLDEITAGEQWVEKQLVEYRARNQKLLLPDLGIPLLLNGQGKELRRIERETHAKLIVSKETNTLHIRGKTPEEVIKAQSALSNLFNSITNKTYTIANEIRSELIGRKGDHINSLRKKYHVSVQLSDTELRIDGMREDVDECDKYLQTWLLNHYVKRIVQSKDLIGRLIIGKQGAQVKQLEKEFHIRIVQTVEEGNSLLSFVGPKPNVDECYQAVDQQITHYLSTHFACQFTANQWNWCPRLSRAAIETVQKQNPHSKIVVVASLGSIRCEGPAHEITALKALFEEIQDQEKDKEVFKIEVPKEHLGLVIGKNGNTIKEFEKQYHVTMKLQKEESCFTVWCVHSEWQALQQAIHAFIEEKAIVSQSLSISASQRSQLVVDKCRPIRHIQSAYSVQIQLPSPSDSDSLLWIQGTKANCAQAIPSLQSVLAGHYEYHYHYSSECLSQLVAHPSFHIERISLANHCYIHTDSAGNLDIRGTYESIHKAHMLIYTQLAVMFPLQFKQFELTAGCAHYLMNSKTTLGLETPSCVVSIEPFEKRVYVTGTPSMVETKSMELVHTLAILESENVILQIEQELIPILIGPKGRFIKEMQEESHCQINVLKTTNELVLHGTKEHVECAQQFIKQRIREFYELNCRIQTTKTIFNSFLNEYGNLLGAWEEENACTLQIDKKAYVILIRGKNKENVENMKYVVETMLETIEMNEEKENTHLMEETLRGEEVNDAMLQINSLLGLE